MGAAITPSVGSRPAAVNPGNQVYGAFVARDESIRPAESPTDMLMVDRPVVLSGTTGTVAVPFKVGSKVYYQVLQEIVVTDDGNGNQQIAFDTSSDAIVRVAVQGRASQLQVAHDIV